MKLHLGVLDVPYAGEVRAPGSKAASGTQTTGDVATWLENKYHPMEHFWQIHGQQVADDVAGGLAGALESMLMGAPATLDPFGTAMSKTEERFKDMLSTGELERIGYPGLPTEAAKKRRSLRFKSKKKKTARPSLIDTGLYQASFKSWIDQ